MSSPNKTLNRMTKSAGSSVGSEMFIQEFQDVEGRAALPDLAVVGRCWRTGGA